MVSKVINKAEIEQFGATVEFVSSGDVVIGYCTTILDDGVLVVEVRHDDQPRAHHGTHFVSPSDVESVEVEH